MGVAPALVRQYREILNNMDDDYWQGIAHFASDEEVVKISENMRWTATEAFGNRWLEKLIWV
jgi:hypothetical protein